MQSISHHSKHILNQPEKILLVEWLGYIGGSTDIQKQFVQNIKPLNIKRVSVKA